MADDPRDAASAALEAEELARWCAGIASRLREGPLTIGADRTGRFEDIAALLRAQARGESGLASREGECDKVQATAGRPSGSNEVPHAITSPSPAPSGLRCKKCDTELVRLDESSEPEGLRRDGRCPQCGTRYMVTKAHLVEMEPAPSGPSVDGPQDDLGRPSASPAPVLPEITAKDVRAWRDTHRAIAVEPITCHDEAPAAHISGVAFDREVAAFLTARLRARAGA